MSRVIQLISHNQHLFALTDAGEIFATPSVLNAKWSLFEGPIPLQPSCRASASDKQCESRLNRENVIPEIERMHKLIPDPQSGCPSMETTWMNPNVRRRPTSIGSDGNYIPPTGD